MTVSRKNAKLLFRCSIFLAAAVLVAACAGPRDGEKLFFSTGCSQCHSFQGRGGRMGPDLSAVSNIRDIAWIDRYLQEPRKMNPLSRMPSFRHLSGRERRAIIAFLRQ